MISFILSIEDQRVAPFPLLLTEPPLAQPAAGMNIDLPFEEVNVIPLTPLDAVQTAMVLSINS